MFLIASKEKAFITEYSGHLFRFIAATYSGKRSSGAAREQTEDVNNPRVHVYSPYHAPSLCEGRKGKQLGSEFLIADTRHTRNENVVCTIDGVRDCHKIRARGNQNNIFVDLHVLVEPSLSVEKGHVIASPVEYVLKNKISNIVDVVVHIEPLPKVPPDQS
jgi:divalent metal cation (Fe/Co/Zn/Cd) transporter